MFQLSLFGEYFYDQFYDSSERMEKECLVRDDYAKRIPQINTEVQRYLPPVRGKIVSDLTTIGTRCEIKNAKILAGQNLYQALITAFYLSDKTPVAIFYKSGDTGKKGKRNRVTTHESAIEMMAAVINAGLMLFGKPQIVILKEHSKTWESDMWRNVDRIRELDKKWIKANCKKDRDRLLAWYDSECERIDKMFNRQK